MLTSEICIVLFRFTYEIAPVFTLMEDIVLTRMRELVGWRDGDGIFAPGLNYSFVVSKVNSN